ncbi:MAG TPA: ABC transporter permease [Cyclobacteriaceae bacterium]|nr:ABC transporter permease [Cyclobacteriaceae bacterium]
MIRNFFLVAYRSMARQVSYSLINIVGLAIGIACSLVIFLFVYGEWSYDKGFANSKRIYKVGVSFFNMGGFATAPEKLFNVLPTEFEGIEAATRISRSGNVPFEVGDQTLREPLIYYTDSSFFKVFQYQFVAGDPKTVLKAPNEVVVTESAAIRYFGNTDVVGKMIAVGNDKKQFFITGVVKDLDFNATVKAPFFFSNHETLTGKSGWSSASAYNFLLLKENVDRSALEAALDRVIEKNVFPEHGKDMGIATVDAYRQDPKAVKFHVFALEDIYLKSKLNFEMVAGGNESNVYVFSAISLFILALAGINFINLTTARASRRAKEVGIRKAMGTSRSKLIFQFLGESIMITTIAMVLALVLAELFLLAFTYITGSPLLTTIWKNAPTVLLFVVFSITVGILSGLYPAFYLTAFNPVKVLKGNVSVQGGLSFRNILVVFQFAVSMILIVCAVVVQQQLHYVQTKELGFSPDNILTIDQGHLMGSSKAKAFKNELAAHTGVITSAFYRGEPGSKRVMSFWSYKTPDMQDGLSINTYLGDADYVDLMGMKLIQGRKFNKDLASDTASIILNESAVAALGLPDDPIGAIVNKGERVIGVVKDYHWESLHNTIAPSSIRFTDSDFSIGFKLEPEHVKDFLATAEKKWKEMMPNESFVYHFVDDNFTELLKKDEVFGKAINFFTLLAILISCLGLYGLSAFTAEQRTREIGIRKVLGASSSQIVIMLNRKFTVLVVIAILAGVPTAVWLVSQWLEDFAYRITPGVGVYLGSIALALLTAWLTVSYHSVRASWVNPSEALKYE